MVYEENVKECGVESREEKKMTYLLGVINNTISCYREAINRYEIMNDGLVGVSPEGATGDTEISANGVVSELILRAEYLHDLCTDLDRQNNRLNQIVVDG